MKDMKEALKRARVKSQDIVLNISLGSDDKEERDLKDKEAGLSPTLDGHEMKEAEGMEVPEGEYLGDPLKQKYLDKLEAEEAIDPEKNSGLPPKKGTIKIEDTPTDPSNAAQDQVGLALLAGESENPKKGLGSLKDKVKHGIRISMGKK